MTNTNDTTKKSSKRDGEPASRFQGKKYLKIASGLLLVYLFWFCMLVLILRWYNPPFTAFTLQENWDELNQERYSLRENWVPSADLPDHLKLAVIASEDQRFFEHWGVDFTAMEKAVEENEQGQRVRGASTITQQVAKNLFLTPAQNYLRKGIEAGIAILIEVFWSKDRILEVYLNIAEFGPGVYGTGKASEFWFGKESSALTAMESSRLAAVLPNPKLIKANPPSEYVQNRSTWILRNMGQLSGLRYLPKPPADTTDTLQNIQLPFDSITANQYLDTLDIPDSLLQLDTLPLEHDQMKLTDSLSANGLPDSLSNE